MAPTVTWAQGIDGTWQTTLDWNPNVVPGTGDNVFITPAGIYKVTTTQTTTIDSLVIASTATLDIASGTFTITDGTSSGALAGTIEVENGALLDFPSGTITHTGTLEAASGAGVVFAGVDVTNNGGTVIVDAGSTLDLASTTISGGVLNNAGTVDVTGGGTSTLTGVTLTNTSGAGVGTLALDGNGFTSKPFVASTSASVNLTTSKANDVIILEIVQNGASVSAVSDTAGLIWHQRAIAGSGSSTIYEYYAIAANALTADAITVSFAGTASYADVNAFAVSGANTSSPFDGNGSVPVTAATSSGAVTTSNANDFIFAGYRFNSNSTPGAGSGWTAINASGGYYLSEYQIVSATQANLVATASSADQNGGIVDAIVQAPAPPATGTGTVTVEGGSTLDLNETTIAAGTLINAGTLDVTGGNASSLSGVAVANSGGAVQIDIGATLDLAGTSITAGTLNNIGTLNSTGISALNGVGVTNSGTLEVSSGATIDLVSLDVANSGGTIKTIPARNLLLPGRH